MYVLLRIQINDGKKEIEIGNSFIGESKFEILDWTSHLPTGHSRSRHLFAIQRALAKIVLPMSPVKSVT